MWQSLLRHCAVLTKVSEEFAPHYLAEIRHDMRQTTLRHNHRQREHPRHDPGRYHRMSSPVRSDHELMAVFLERAESILRQDETEQGSLSLAGGWQERTAARLPHTLCGAPPTAYKTRNT